MKRIKKSIPLLGLLFLAPLSCFAHWIPHIANGRFSGGSVRTAFILMNTTDVTVSATILLTADDGSPLVVTIPNYGTDSSFRISILPHRTVTIQTDGTGPLMSGAATIDFNYFIGISAIFSIYDEFGNLTAETGIGSSFWFSSFSIPVEASGGYTTGIAFFNPNSEPVSLSADLIENNGTRRIRGGIPGSPLPPKGHLARFAAELFPNINFGNGFSGILEIRATRPITAIALRQSNNPLTFTTLPIFPTEDLAAPFRGSWVGSWSSYTAFAGGSLESEVSNWGPEFYLVGTIILTGGLVSRGSFNLGVERYGWFIAPVGFNGGYVAYFAGQRSGNRIRGSYILFDSNSRFVDTGSFDVSKR